MMLLSQEFYNRSPLVVAPEILGKILVRRLNNQIISGRIVEVEAYLAFIDEAAHSFVGRTKRNTSIFKSAGHAYVYSMHRQNCFDVVTEGIDVPSCVLVRALEPLEGIELMRRFRNKEKLTDLTSGPGKLAQALSISKEFDGVDITKVESNLYIVDDNFLPGNVVTTKRVGIFKARDKYFRFCIEGSRYLSRK